METGAIGVILSGPRLLERSRSAGVGPRNDVPSLRRVTFRVTSELHHPPRRTRLDVGLTAPTGGTR
jgi:hypothetical protein